MRRTKKIKQILKTYFYFSQGERKGILVLGVLMVVFMLLPTVFRVFSSMPEIEVKNLAIQSAKATDDVSITETQQLFSFNPNTASEETLIKLGFSAKQAQNLIHYRQKGGVFKSPSDLGKLYGISPTLLQQIIPYVSIPGQVGQHTKDSLSARREKSQQLPLELNSSDSLAIVKLYRIGPALTHRILEFRSRLGGFVSLKQLTEIYGFDEDILYDLDGKIWVDASKARIWNVNTVTTDELKTHPYFKYKLSNAIVNYRLQHGPYLHLADLRNIVIVNDSIYRNIIQYLKVN